MFILARTVVLLLIANVFMTYAWYGHLRDLRTQPLYVAVLVSWGVAFFEYWFQVYANRTGARVLTLPQLKIIQEVITLAVFVAFSTWYMKQQVTRDLVYAGICLCGAVYFVFRKGLPN